jgi:hypothetical protein
MIPIDRNVCGDFLWEEFMKTHKNIEGYWMHYISSVQQSLGRSLTEKEISALMKLYISGIKIEKALEEFK